MTANREQDFTIQLSVTLDGYGSLTHEEKLADKVESLLRLKLGDKVTVKPLAVVRHEDERRVS